MTFNGLIKTARPPQRPGGAQPEAAPEPGETAHLAQRTRGPSSFGREEASAARPRPGEGERAGQAATRRLGTAGRKQSGGEERRDYSSAVCTGSACAGRAGAEPQHRDPAPKPRRVDGSRERVRERRGQRRGTRAVTHGPGKPRAPQGAILEPSCAAPTSTRPEDAECRHPPPPGPISPSTRPAQGKPLTLPSKLFSSTSLMSAESWPRG